jgi:c-di-GMP-binding flagellar brake protein YcgR
VTSERRRSWRTEVSLDCTMHRRAGKTIEARTVDIGPGGMQVHTSRPLSIDEVLDFELPARPRLNGRARVLREQAYRIYALRFEKLGEDARAEIAELTQPRDRTTGT